MHTSHEYCHARTHTCTCSVWRLASTIADLTLHPRPLLTCPLCRTQGHGYGLVHHDYPELFLLQLWAEMAHVCTRGSWTCFESRGMPNFTPAGGYTTPSQVRTFSRESRNSIRATLLLYFARQRALLQSICILHFREYYCRALLTILTTRRWEVNARQVKSTDRNQINLCAVKRVGLKLMIQFLYGIAAFTIV